MSPAKKPLIPNQLLAQLSKKEYQTLEPYLEEIPLVFEEFLYRPSMLVSDVYFPNSGIVSMVAGVHERSTLEVGLIGKEGMVGLGIFMGVDTTLNHAVVQGAGSAMKMKAAAFRQVCKNGGALPQLLLRYSHSVFTQITQSAVCNQLHSIDARLSRWLLMTHDRMVDDEFQITQEFLSNMLGVRREGVNKAAGDLQQRELIRYSRGRLTVLDRLGLEDTSCGCYQIIKEESSSAFT